MASPSRRRLPVLSTVAALTLLVGCGSSGSDNSSSGGGSSGSPLKIAIVQPYTGDSAYYGTYAKNAFALAMANYGSKPGGHPISFVKGDSKCVPASAVQAGNQVLAQSPVVMLAPACSGDTLALAPLLKAHNVAACSINLAPTITKEGGSQIYRAAPSDADTNDKFAAYMAGKGVKTIGIVHDTSGYGQGNVDSLVAALKKNNIEVAVNAAYDFSATDYSGQIIKLKRANVDAAYFEGYDLAVGNLIKQAKQLQLKAIYFANTNAGNATAGKAAGSALDGVEFATAFLPDASATASKFTDEWTKRFGVAPDSDSTDLYQCAVVILKAITGAGSKADGATVGAAMAKVSVTGLPTGDVAFSADRELTAPPVLIGTWEGGKTKLVKRLSGAGA